MSDDDDDDDEEEALMLLVPVLPRHWPPPEKGTKVLCAEVLLELWPALEELGVSSGCLSAFRIFSTSGSFCFSRD